MKIIIHIEEGVVEIFSDEDFSAIVVDTTIDCFSKNERYRLQSYLDDIEGKAELGKIKGSNAIFAQGKGELTFYLKSLISKCPEGEEYEVF